MWLESADKCGVIQQVTDDTYADTHFFLKVMDNMNQQLLADFLVVFLDCTLDNKGIIFWKI
jgi:hypothetical protein